MTKTETPATTKMTTFVPSFPFEGSSPPPTSSGFPRDEIRSVVRLLGDPVAFLCN